MPADQRSGPLVLAVGFMVPELGAQDGRDPVGARGATPQRTKPALGSAPDHLGRRFNMCVTIRYEPSPRLTCPRRLIARPVASRRS